MSKPRDGASRPSRTARRVWRPGVALPRPEGAAPPRPDVLDNPASVRVTRVAALARRQARSRHGRFLAEGPQCVREALHWASAHVTDVYATAEAAEREPELLSEARRAGVYAHTVTAPVMSAMSTDAQGLLAVVRTEALAAPALPADGRQTDRESGRGSDRPADREGGGPEPSGPGGLTGALTGARLVAILAEAQDPGNAGTIIRAADAAGADAVVLARGSVDATNPKVVRATAGSLFHLPVLGGIGLEEALAAARTAGLSVLAADGRAATGVFDADLSGPTAWLLGNEARGLSERALHAADGRVSIPLYGLAESLNVASAAAVCLYASARAQRAAG